MSAIHAAIPVTCPVCDLRMSLPITLESTQDAVKGKPRSVTTETVDVAAHLEAHLSHQ